jgi:hypothetical protein
MITSECDNRTRLVQAPFSKRDCQMRPQRGGEQKICRIVVLVALGKVCEFAVSADLPPSARASQRGSL